MQKLSELLKQKYQSDERDIVLDGADFISQKGYTLLPNYVLHTKELTPYAKLIYAMLLSYAWGKKNSSFPGQETLAEDCGISRRSAISALQELEKRTSSPSFGEAKEKRMCMSCILRRNSILSVQLCLSFLCDNLLFEADVHQMHI